MMEGDADLGTAILERQYVTHGGLARKLLRPIAEDAQDKRDMIDW